MNFSRYGVCDALPHAHPAYGPAYLLRIFHYDPVLKKGSDLYFSEVCFYLHPETPMINLSYNVHV